jgi:hypothetical protein
MPNSKIGIARIVSLQRHLEIDAERGSFYAVLLTPLAREEKIACDRLVVPQGGLTMFRPVT